MKHLLLAICLLMPAVVLGQASPEDTSPADVSDTSLVDNPSSAVLAQEISEDDMPQLSFALSPAEVKVGEVTVWSVTAKKKNATDRIVLDTKLNFGGLEIQQRVDDAVSDDEMTDRLEVHLLSFKTGMFTIPEVKVSVLDAEGNLTEVMTPPYRVDVKSHIANEPEPQLMQSEVKPAVVVEDDYTLLYIVGTVVAILLIVLLTLLGIKIWKMRQRNEKIAYVPPRPVEEVALEKLAHLKSSQYLEEKMFKTFHLKLSEALREYLGGRYGFYCLESATSEISSVLRQKSISLDLYRAIVDLLEDSDLVKFARFEPTVEDSQALLERALDIVHKTTPQKTNVDPALEVSDDN